MTDYAVKRCFRRLVHLKLWALLTDSMTCILEYIKELTPTFAHYFQLDIGLELSFSVLELREVRENSRNLSTFSLLLEKPNFKNPCSYRFKHVKVVFMLMDNAVPCCAFRGISL